MRNQREKERRSDAQATRRVLAWSPPTAGAPPPDASQRQTGPWTGQGRSPDGEQRAPAHLPGHRSILWPGPNSGAATDRTGTVEWKTKPSWINNPKFKTKVPESTLI